MLPLITGVGLCSALGGSLDETWRAVCAGGAIGDHARAAGGSDRLDRMATAAAREAMEQAGWSAPDLTDDPPAIVFGTSKGPIERWLHQTPGGAAAGGFGLGESAWRLADELGLLGPRLTISAACASGLLALIRGVLMLRGGEARRALVAAVEASVHPLFIGSFRRMGALPPVGELCRPFDRRRRGLLMSEAAAAVCLELPDARRRADPPLAAVERFAFGGDATHLTAADPDAALLRHLLARVVDGRGVDLVHAHGTGTESNDAAELSAIEAALPARGRAGSADGRPALYSHKAALGHSLGAAGLVSVALSCMMHRHAIVPPNVSTIDPLPTQRVRIDRHLIRRPVGRSLVIAAGFGGATAVVSLLNVDPTGAAP